MTPPGKVYELKVDPKKCQYLFCKMHQLKQKNPRFF